MGVPRLNQYQARINVLAQGHNTVTLVRLQPTATRSQVKHSTTEPLRSLSYALCICEVCELYQILGARPYINSLWRKITAAYTYRFYQVFSQLSDRFTKSTFPHCVLFQWRPIRSHTMKVKQIFSA